MYSMQSLGIYFWRQLWFQPMSVELPHLQYSRLWIHRAAKGPQIFPSPSCHYQFNPHTLFLLGARTRKKRSVVPEMRQTNSKAAVVAGTTTVAANKVYSPLVSSCRHLLRPNGSIVGRHVARTVLPLFPSMCSAIPADEYLHSRVTGGKQQQQQQRAALASIDGRRPLSHTRIRDFILSELGPALHDMGFGRGHRIAIVLPNGPELALAILSIANWACCVPLNASGGATSELAADLQRARINLVIGPSSSSSSSRVANNNDNVSDSPFHVLKEGLADFSDLGRQVQECALRLGIPFVGLTPSSTEAGIFSLGPLITNSRSTTSTAAATNVSRFSQEADVSAGGAATATTTDEAVSRYCANTHQDPVLILFTSGTTGHKKVVPHRLGDMLVATATIALSWDLVAQDVNCNLMPLFHVGGIVRQVFSPILSGGCVVCCPSFDPHVFWTLHHRRAFTWYYAAPTMHQLLLQTKPQQQQQKDGDIASLRMIANAAGGLLPSLARELRQTFGGAHVLPSYGMTECMPISSPPSTYQLEKPGTSGVAVGPEIAILDIPTRRTLPPGQEGPICVRGEPCFKGYGHTDDDPPPTGPSATTTFLEGGWFNTGDLGYMDEDGYLYITGRSKEVINRGGEIISPLEVEEAVVSHAHVKACAAISVGHNVLQEVVGIVVVPEPSLPRVDLKSLQQHLSEGRLTAPKWPQCVVFMDALPKSHTNKLLRVRLGQRLGLPELNDAMYPIERTFQAKCPPQGTSIQVAIPSEQVKVSPESVYHVLSQHLPPSVDQQLWVVDHPTMFGSLVVHVYNMDGVAVMRVAQDHLDQYAVPSHYCQLSRKVPNAQHLLPPQPTDATLAILEGLTARGPVDPLVREVQVVFQELLDLDCHPSATSSFFHLGGSSMLASQLASRIRKKHGVPFSGAEIFHHSSCESIAAAIQQRQMPTASSRSGGGGGGGGGSDGTDQETDASSQLVGIMTATSSFQKHVSTQGSPFPSKRLPPEYSCVSGLLHLIPLFVVFPIWQTSRFFLFFSCLLVTLHHMPIEQHVIIFVTTLVFFHFLWVTLTPLIFVIIKWVVVGRYREGRYAFWSSMYMRWWIVDVCRKLFGKGVWGSSEPLLNVYYRMLGAKIGKNARISLETDIAEYDLVHIGDNAAVEYSTFRGFGVDNGCMILGAVGLGNNASVGCRSVVAPFTSIPDNAHLGAVTSSYEIGTNLDAKNARVNRRIFPQPALWAQLLVGTPITFLVDSLSHMPALAVLYWMLMMPWHHDEPFSSMADLMAWLCDYRRIPFYIGIRVARAVVAPFVYMGGSILVKWLIIGKFQPGPRDTSSQWQLLRHWLSATLFSRQNMQEVTEILGRHYELVSCLYRLLGAKVGKRVFWPGSQPVFSGEFELLEIGDDVVFGSRSTILCATVDSCEKVILCAGANVADNCVVMPGGIIGKNAVLGSNSVCPEGRYLPEASVWFGSRGGEPVMLEKGVEDVNEPIQSRDMDTRKLQMVGDESTLRPFGRAFYKGEATYWVMPLPIIILITLISKVLIATIHTLPLLGALHGAAEFLYGERNYDWEYSIFTVYTSLLVAFAVCHLGRVIMWLGTELAAKWVFVGRREEGRYNWDTSPYAQNWELLQILTRVRRFGRLNLMDFITGTPFINEFFRLQGARIGKETCMFPSGGDPYLTEPDLVTIGDGCAVDCAAIIAHLNTRGNFELAKIVVENHATLRQRSRIQMGVHMEAGSMLLEKSLAMTGEIIEADSVWQGAPAAKLFSYESTAILPSTSFMGGALDDHEDEPIHDVV